MQHLLEVIRRFLIDRQTAYRQTFASNRATDAVLKDLAKFCRANQSTFHPDPHVAARLDGRREVWLRICDHLGMTSDELMARYNGEPKKDAGV